MGVVTMSRRLFTIGALCLGLGCSGEPVAGGRAVATSHDGPQVVDAGTALAPPLDAHTSATGLISLVTREGHGERRPASHDRVRVAFTAWNGKGEVSDSSEKRGAPEVFEVKGVIAGWAEALLAMRVGERRKLWIPDHLTYPGRPGPPRPLALFELELLEIIPGKAPPPVPADVAAAPTSATRSASGLAYIFVGPHGGAERPRAWDRVTLHYAGWTPDGALFESSPAPGAVVDVAEVMPGWRELLPLLAPGERVRAWLPEALAYQGRAGSPRGNVVFELELVGIERRPEPPRPPRDVARAPRDAQRTPSGLAYRVIRPGSGALKPGPGDRVEVHYSAFSADGTLFDSSVVRGKPALVPVDRVIEGWGEGLQRMTEGEKTVFWIPEALAYGGRDGAPRGTLVYEVELLRIVRP